MLLIYECCPLIHLFVQMWHIWYIWCLFDLSIYLFINFILVRSCFLITKNREKYILREVKYILFIYEGSKLFHCVHRLFFKLIYHFPKRCVVIIKKRKNIVLCVSRVKSYQKAQLIKFQYWKRNKRTQFQSSWRCDNSHDLALKCFSLSDQLYVKYARICLKVPMQCKHALKPI